MGDLLTVKQAANILGLQESTVRKWVLSRRMGVVRLGRSVRLRRDEVESLIKRNYVSPIVDSVPCQTKWDKCGEFAKVMFCTHRHPERSEDEAKTGHQTRSRQAGPRH